MLTLTPNQIEEVLEIIQTHQLKFISNYVGMDMLSNSEIKQLGKAGIDVKSLPAISIVENAFKFGILSAALEEGISKKLTYNQFKDFLKETDTLKLTSQEDYALNQVKTRAYSDIKGLGNKIGTKFQTLLIEQNQAKREEYEKIIKDTSAKTIITKQSITQMVSELGTQTADWSRDFGRISDFILHSAFDTGRAEKILEEYGEDAEVYKDVYPHACKHCIRLYTTGGVGSEPLTFKVKDLLKNGTNIGKKTEDWLPVIGSTHPHCRCTIRRVPQGYSWSNEKGMYSIPTKERKVERQSKVIIKFGDKTIRA